MALTGVFPRPEHPALGPPPPLSRAGGGWVASAKWQIKGGEGLSVLLHETQELSVHVPQQPGPAALEVLPTGLGLLHWC